MDSTFVCGGFRAVWVPLGGLEVFFNYKARTSCLCVAHERKCQGVPKSGNKMEMDKTENLGAFEEAVAARRHPRSRPRTQKTLPRGKTADGHLVPKKATMTMLWSWECSTTQCMIRLSHTAGQFSKYDCPCRRTKGMRTSVASQCLSRKRPSYQCYRRGRKFSALQESSPTWHATCPGSVPSYP